MNICLISEISERKEIIILLENRQSAIFLNNMLFLIRRKIEDFPQAYILITISMCLCGKKINHIAT